VNSRPSLWQPNAWHNVLNGGYQIEIWEGYGRGAEVDFGGSAIVKTFVGLIENCEVDTDPDHITITTRDFGLVLTDERLMGWNKAVEIRAPVTFADRKQTQGEQIVFQNPKASSTLWPWVASVLPGNKLASWVSGQRNTPTDIQWLEVELPAGHYEEFLMQGAPGQVVWVAINAAAGSTKNGSDPLPTGWVDVGLGNVPGTTTPYVSFIPSCPVSATRFEITPPAASGGGGVQGYDLAAGSKMRFFVSNLARTLDKHRHQKYEALLDIAPLRFQDDKTANSSWDTRVNDTHWVLVEDAAGPVRMVLMWAGFREWAVTDFGWSLFKPLIFHEQQFLVEIVDAITAIGNTCFHIAPPTDLDESIGVPTLELQTATDNPPPDMLEVRDTDLLERAQVTWDLSELPYILRYRGDITPKGVTWEEDLTKRYMGVYWPPWADTYNIQPPPCGRGGPGTGRLSNLVRHFTETIGTVPGQSLESDIECLFACILACIQYALRMAKVEFQIAGLPNLRLNRQISLVEDSAGVNSRVWVASIESEHTLGPRGKWTMKVGGSLLDTEDMQLLAWDYAQVYEMMLPTRPPSMVGVNPAPPPDKSKPFKEVA
jgi:hypothetical protein